MSQGSGASSNGVKMKLAVLGINHKTAPVEVREKFSFGGRRIAEVNHLLKETAALSENLILSTCNRVEIYAVTKNDDLDCVSRIKDFLGKYRKINISDFKNRFYFHQNEKVVEHLFRVASGLDSMVFGEMEILGQVKEAYRAAHNAKTTGKVLHRLFEKAFNTAKKIRSETALTVGTVSVSSAAIRLARKILGELGDKKALIIGAGTVGEQLLLYLKKTGIKDITVANRSFEKARVLAKRFGAEPVAFESYQEKLSEADILIASTGAPHCIVKKDDILRLMPKRRQKPLFLIDLAVPRDVEEEVNKIDNVYLYDIDDLEKIVDENINLRKDELENCEKIIVSARQQFIEWLTNENLKHHEN